MLENKLPKHVAIIMDGNGRWAKQRYLPRVAGHKAGYETVREVIRACVTKGISVLTLFAFSSENWTRPVPEVDALMQLLIYALRHEVKKLYKNNVQLRVIGNLTRLNTELQMEIQKSLDLTKNNTGLILVIAIDYGGQWDIVEAAKKIAQKVNAGDLLLENINAHIFQENLSTQNLPAPDLLIRTSGEKRISNFLLWQLAYTEFYFTPVFWPDFNEAILNEAFEHYTQCERRFGNVD